MPFKFSCGAGDLLTGLELVSRAQRKSVLPILEAVLIEPAEFDGRIRLTATNLEYQIVATVPANVYEWGSAAIPMKLLGEFLSVNKKGRVDIDVAKTTVHIKVGGHDARIKGYDPADFVELRRDEAEGDDSTRIGLPAHRFASILANSIIAVDKGNDARPSLLGVNFLCQNGKLECAGADGFRLGVADIEVIGPDVSCIVPAEALHKLALKDGSVAIRLGKGQAVFITDQMTMWIQTIEATFPNYRAVIPSEYVTSARVVKEEFALAINLASMFVRVDKGITKSGAVRLFINPEMTYPMLMLDAASDDGNYETTVSVLESHGPKITIMANARYLRDAINAIETDEIDLQFVSPARPMMLRPVGGETGLHLIMPTVDRG